MPTRFVAMPDEEGQRLPLRVDVKHYSGKQGENITLWIREIEMDMISGLISLEHQRVALTISKINGRAREWTLTCNTSIDLAFPTWDSLKLDILRVFSPPNRAYRLSSRFYSTRQGKIKLADCVQALRTLMDAMQSDPLSETVYVNVFMIDFALEWPGPSSFGSIPPF